MMLPVISRKEARQNGLRRYFTGEPCKNGHVAERNVGTRACLACDVARNVRNHKREGHVSWEKKNPDKMPSIWKKKRKLAKQRNPEKILAQQRAAYKRWEKSNPEGVKKARARVLLNHTKAKVRKALAKADFAALSQRGNIMDLETALDIFKAQDNAFDYDIESLSLPKL